MRYAAILILALSLSGCIGVEKEAEAAAQRADVLSGGYIKNIDKTTPEQDKAHIKAMDAEIRAICAAVCGSAVEAKVRALVAPAVPATGK